MEVQSIKFKFFIITTLIVFNIAKVANAGFIETAQVGSIYLCDKDTAAALVTDEIVQDRQGYGWGVFTLKVIDKNKILFEATDNFKSHYIKTQIEDTYVSDRGYEQSYLVVRHDGYMYQTGYPHHISVNVSSLSHMMTSVSLHKCKLLG